MPPTTTGSPESPYDDAPTAQTDAGHADAADDGVQAGRVELGAAVSAMISSQVRDASATLSFGRFVAERFELLALASVTSLDAGTQAATMWSSLIEPAYHLPLAPATLGVLGMGVGAAYTRALGVGLAVAPRIGVRFRVGRRSVITPALSYVYVTHRALDPADDLAVIAVTGALRLQLGYAVTW